MIEETRQDIINNNNTAQQALEFLLDNVGTGISELNITDPLSGDLNFSILKTKGFRNVKKIRFTTPGNVTSVANLPTGLLSFYCTNQLLVHFSEILPSLEELHLENNHLQHIDLIPMMKLKVLNLNNNRLSDKMEFSYTVANTTQRKTRTTEFSKILPDTLEELYISHNQLRLINIQRLQRLRVLHAAGNRMLRIQNVPASIVDLQIEENPMVEVEYSAMPESTQLETTENVVSKMDYLESLNEYFAMKTKYETDVQTQLRKLFARGRTRKQKQNLVKEYRHPCIKCRRPFGTIFESRDRRYIARCGNAGNPCELNVQLYRGSYELTETLLYEFQTQMEITKEDIISQKLDTLFSYLSEDKSAEKFKQELKMYSIDNNIYKELLNKHIEMHSNPHKRELIRNKIQQIYDLKNAMKQMLTDYQKDGNAEIMHTITDIYIKEYLPEIHNLRLLNYEVMEMIILEDSSSKEDECFIRQLFQKDVALPKLEYLSGEPPRVIAFTKI
jgi:hypothetical protein